MTQQRSALVLFAHPNVRASRVGRALRDAVKPLPGVTFRDLYAEYPDFLIDVQKEQELLEAHHLIIFQHPFYWYSCPPLLKQWLDDVLVHGWAYGDNGTRLAGKVLWSVVSTGGPREAYGPQGYNRFSMRTLLSPFDQTAHLCGMHFAEPLVLHGAGRMDDLTLAVEVDPYRTRLLRCLDEGVLP
ncbi:MAG: NAD(P)H-dependent oxidoreductase [Silvanigrellales bacterium]|nr:NAD(P)H-dependent oxidoreductase [Silvanigrellales bacterium]